MKHQKIKDKVHDHWNEIPVWFQAGKPLDDFEEYSLAYFEEGRRLRYLPERFQCIQDFVDFSKFKDRLVLEIGTGQGCDLVEIAKAGAHVIGADLSSRNCLVTQKRLETYGLSAHLMTLDAERIPLADESVNDVYSFGVLHHTPGMYDAFNEVERILRPGGTVTMMLYRRSLSLWKWQCIYLGWLFMHTVKWDICKRVYRWLGSVFGIKSFSNDELLNDFQDKARAGELNLEKICAFMTDGPTNPLSLFVDKGDIVRGFSSLEPEEFFNCYLGPIPLVNNILPAGLRRFLARGLGGFLFFRLRKPLKGVESPCKTGGMSVEEYRSLLVDPIEKNPLTWHDDYVEAQNGDRYPVVSGIPILRVEDLIE